MKSKILAFARFVLISTLILSMASSAYASKDNTYRTGFIGWQAADGEFGSWTRNGVSLTSEGELTFNLATASAGTDPYPAGGYYGGNYYNSGNFFVGEATSPVISTDPINYTEAIASWNASTPVGTWIEAQFRAQYGGTRWSKWYVLGIWSSDTSTLERHSVRLQGDSDGFVAVDTFVSTNKKEPTNKFQLKFLLFSEDGTATPAVRNASVAYSTSPPKKAAATSTGNPALWNTLVDIPECSQMVYPDGGEVWCSPTSTSMVLGQWMNGGEDAASCEARVRDAVSGVYDWIYDGHGNWPFNTAYAATKTIGATKLEGYVARFTSLAKAEEYVTAGVPVVMSIAWGSGHLTGSDIASTNGHLFVLVGFDAAGNPIINDPASAANETVQRTYLREEVEALWLEASGGTVYLIYPEGWSVPALP